MAKFIEIHRNNVPLLINVDYIEEVAPGNGNCTIYMAFNGPDASTQDYFKPDESYEEVRKLIRSAGG